MSSVSLAQARAAKARALAVFGAYGEVVGVGLVRLADGSYGIKVNFREAPSAPESLPAAVDGVPITIEVVGRIRKL